MVVVVVGGSVVVVVGAVVDVLLVVRAIVVVVEGSVESPRSPLDDVGTVVAAGVAWDVEEHAAVDTESAPIDSIAKMRYRSQLCRHREGVIGDDRRSVARSICIADS